MATMQFRNLIRLLFFFILASHSYIAQGARSGKVLTFSPQETVFDSLQEQDKMSRNSRRLMIGSTAPTCTYNECRGCKYRCRAEQVPVEGNDPINSAYHYKCVCHRP